LIDEQPKKKLILIKGTLTDLMMVSAITVDRSRYDSNKITPHTVMHLPLNQWLR
jgi:hypothetical protein